MASEKLVTAIRDKYGFEIPEDLVSIWSEDVDVLNDEPLARFLGKIAPYRRIAWVPEIEKDGNSPVESKYGGKPWIASLKKWPICGLCNAPLQFFFQLDLATLPGSFSKKETGLLQLFVCSNPASPCFIGEPFSKAVQIAIIQPSGKSDRASPPAFAHEEPEKKIVSWTEVPDYPGWDELKQLGASIDFKTEWDCFEPINKPEVGDKLGGWPYRVQDAPYPECRICNKPMELYFQLDSKGNLHYEFASAYCGHVTRCPQHPDVITFTWECD